MKHIYILRSVLQYQELEKKIFTGLACASNCQALWSFQMFAGPLNFIY